MQISEIERCCFWMKYQNQMLCRGYAKENKPCEYIKDCELCMMLDNDEYGNEIYGCGIGVPDFQCKRDNPYWKPLTKQEFIELYKRMTGRTNISIGELLERAIIDGIVKE